MLSNSSVITMPISEENYSETMTEVIKPELLSHGGDSYFKSIDGKDIHYRYFLADKAKGNVVISHGFTEFAEKFDEMSYYFMKNGYNVFAIDHRGHGYSYRKIKNTSITHIDEFDEYVTDLHYFVNKVVLHKSKDLPLYLYGHSMGGAIAILYIQRYQNIFEKAILTAPMVFPQTAGIPAFVTKAMAGTFSMIGKSTEKVFVHTEFDPNYAYENSNSTSPARFEYYMDMCRADKNYQNNAATYKWVLESLRITKQTLGQKYCEKINIPVYLMQAETDKAVKKDEQVQFISMVKGAKLKEFKGSKHEIYMSNNEVLKEYLEEIFEFLED